VFWGESQHTLDAKKRVFVPKRFQKTLVRNEDGHLGVVLTRGFEGCLFLFAESHFEVLLKRLRTQPFGGAKARWIQRKFFSKTHLCTLDGSGRLVLPEKLREFAGIGKDVVMVGVADRAEIWDRARWEELDSGSDWEAFTSRNDDDFDELGVILMGEEFAEEGEG